MKGFVHVCFRYLLELDCEGDPAWDTLCNMHKWMLRLLYNSKEEFQGTGKLPSGELTLSPHSTSNCPLAQYTHGHPNHPPTNPLTHT